MSNTVEVLDWRGLRPDPPPLVRGKRRHLVRAGHVVRRDPRTVVGVTLHQTATRYGPADDRERRLRRALDTPYHALAYREGAVVLTQPLDWYSWHGNGLNESSLGLAIEGLYSGLADDPSTTPREDLRTTWGGPPDDVTELVVTTAREALRVLVELGRAEGMPLRYIWAHRQSSATRRSDPGQEPWQRVVLEYAVPVLGLEVQPSRTWRDGRPIPREWGGAGPY